MIDWNGALLLADDLDKYDEEGFVHGDLYESIDIEGKK